MSGANRLRQFILPEGFYPYALVRYWAGAILPVPGRLDTLVFGEDPNYVVATYRATFPALKPIRKLEFRVVVPDAAIVGYKNETRESTLLRSRAMRAYFDKCPASAGAGGEACGSLDYLYDADLLRTALFAK